MSEPKSKFDAAVTDMRDIIRRDVAGGFRDVSGIAAAAVEAVAVDGIDPEALEPVAEELVREVLSDFYRAQTEWPDRTDCDRLDEAFAELEDRGILCRQDFSCCGTCGAGEIWDEINAATDAGKPVRGYAFYHMQDTESAVEGCGLYLAYGATDAGEDAALSVGRELVEVLSAHNLTTRWDGSWKTRIKVNLDWKRRRPLIAGFRCAPPKRSTN
ncbi:MAG TPA: hypothetical protein VD866_02250 [Urbifossiella sp.]|nr:hypothetical protein [Urbifossiella sp.]